MLCAVVAYGKISLFEGNNNLVLTLQGSLFDNYVGYLRQTGARTY